MIVNKLKRFHAILNRESFYYITDKNNIKEIDDIIEAVLLLVSVDKSPTTLNQIFERVIEEVKASGYHLNSDRKKKIENRLRANLYRRGIELKKEEEIDNYKVNVDS